MDYGKLYNEEDGVAINDGQPVKKGFSLLTVVGLVLFVAGCAVGTTWFIATRVLEEGVHYNPGQRYVVPEAYAADLEFHIPYMSFTEPLEAQVDSKQGSAVLSYYSGMDTYIYNTKPNTSSYAITPVVDKQTCFELQDDGIPALFPDLTLFQKTDKVESVTTRAYPSGIKCDIWEYVVGKPTQDVNGSASAVLPTEQGYAGIYQFKVSHNDGTPVQFSLQGHNVVLGGSHVDEYHLDYLSITTVPAVAAGYFKPPGGMPCISSDSPFGPTGHRTHARQDIALLFPKGQETRDHQYQDYVKQHDKTYEGAEYTQRSELYHAALRYIGAANRRGKPYTLAPNHLADLTEAEQRGMRGRNRNAAGVQGGADPYDPATGCSEMELSGKTLPDEVDWRSKSEGGQQEEPGMVLPPKDQGTCGSCWTFGLTGTVEGAVARKTGALVPLSEQAIMDCTWTEYGNAACNGGNDYTGLWWLLNEGNDGAMATDKSYGGYLNQNGFCHYKLATNQTMNPWSKQPVQEGARVASCVHTSAAWKNYSQKVISDEEATEALSDALLNIGPISVSIDASPLDFYYYKEGYYYNSECTWNDLDHTVLAVGYKVIEGQRYTLIRNSWSTNWGDNGYAWISQKDNNCGVATSPIFVTLK